MFNKQKIESLCDHNQEMEFFYDSIINVAKTLDSDAIFIEIGTRAGGTALLALNAILDSKISRQFITVDPYGNKPYFAGKETFGGIYGEDYYQVAMKEISTYCFNNKLYHTHFKIESSDFIKIFEQVKFWYEGRLLNTKFGYVFLDGEHTEEAIVKELEWFLPRMYNGGLIVIDDVSYNPNPTNELLKEVFSKSINKGNRAFYKIEYI